MMGARTRGRRRRRGGSRLAVGLALTLVFGTVVAFLAAPSVAFTSGTLSRASTATVADDADGLLGLDVAASVAAGSDARLVTVTNRLDRSVSVRVTLDSSAGVLSGDRSTLAPGESLRTAVSISCASPPEDVLFTVGATADSGFTATATRSTSVDADGCTDSAGPFVYVSGTAATGTFSGPGGGPTGSLAFTVRNTGTASRTITALTVAEAGRATALSFDGPPPLNLAAGKDEVYVDATGGSTDSRGGAEASRGASGYAVGTAVPLDQSVTVDGGETARVSLYQFRADRDAYGFVSGDRVTVTVTVDDGSESSVSFTV